MSYNGSGTFNLYTPGNPVVTGTTIASTWANNTLSDIATGLSTAITKNGQTTITANIPFANFKLTGLGAATAGTDAAQYKQIQSGEATYLTAVSGTNTITATAAASMAAYVTGQIFCLVPANTNTGATTLNLNSIAAKNVFCLGAACIGGELRANVPVLVEYDGTQFNLIGITKAATQQILLTGTAATYTTPANCRQIRVREKGGGGGGEGTGTTAPSGVTAGGTTSFNGITAIGGGAGNSSGVGGTGGTGGSGTAFRLPGAAGGGILNIFSSATNSKYVGGSGGGAGGGIGGNGAAGGNAGVTNSGGGGGGGGVPSTAWASLQNWFSGGGGGEGEYAEFLITSPASSYTYTVGGAGTGGTGGTSGQNGAAGGSGYIVVDEYY